MTFGKNRVQYNEFFWSFYRFENFDVYFNEYGKELANFTGETANKKLLELEDFLDYHLKKRLILLVYNKQSDFRQSNIGLVTGKEESNLGGKSTILDNKIFLYYQGDHKAFKQQITRAIVTVLMNEMIFGSNRSRNNNSKIEFPDWYSKGLSRFLADNWDFELENKVKDGILSGKYKNLNYLEREDAVIAGQSFWKYIADTYGINVIPNVLYITKINNNFEKGFYYVLGDKLRTLNKQWVKHYKNLFADSSTDRNDPEGTKIVNKPKKGRVYEQIKVSPDGKNIAYITNELGQYKVWIYNINENKSRRIYKKEPKVEQIIDYSYPVIAWHPTGKVLTMITEEKGGLDILFYRLSNKKWERNNLLYFDKILDFSYTPDGASLIFSAMKNGLVDLYLFDVVTGTNEQLTRDLADDLYPRFTSDGRYLIFSSNRLRDTLSFDKEYDKSVGLNFDLFLYDLQKRSPILIRLAEGKYVDKTYPVPFGHDKYLYLGDQNGVINRYLARFDSSISYVDTTVHYRYFARSEALTNYDRNILDEDYNQKNQTVGEVQLKKGRYNMYFNRLEPSELEGYQSLKETPFRRKHSRDLHKLDSLELLRQKLIEEDKRMRDTLPKPLYANFETDNDVDINDYIFEKEKENYYLQKIKKNNIEVDLDTTKLPIPPIRIYETSFYTNYLASQIDFSYLNNTYQYFNGSGVYFNPGIGYLFNIGTNDLFEDYKLVGGFRFSADFNSNEYLLSFENLKKRLDKQLVFHRQAFKSYIESENARVKVYSHQLYYSLRFPFNQVMAVKGTAGLRTDRQVYLATDRANLIKKNDFLSWLTLKLEYIYDNTRFRGINIYNGTRFKIFGEAYRQIERKKSDLFVLGADFRYYQKIHRDLIWANRFAASTSFGHNKLIYYLGGVDNWFNLFNMDGMFNKEIPIDYTKNYVFQTVATPMRGFKQNIRNGNNFALINSELRWPIIRYFVNHPISNNFLNNFQIVGFTDIGTAWTGWNPYAGENSYDKKEIRNGPITVILKTNREPIVAGYGFGLRSMLFGYFIRLDWAWGIENFEIQPRMFYLSMSLDF